jgi:hypothetical protein
MLTEGSFEAREEVTYYLVGIDGILDFIPSVISEILVFTDASIACAALGPFLAESSFFSTLLLLAGFFPFSSS